MDRETKEIVTPVHKNKLVIYTYMTGREFEYAQAPLLEAMSIKPEMKDVKFGNIDVHKVQEATHRLIEKLVVSVNGETSGVLDAILDLPNDDYQFIVDALNEIHSPKKKLDNSEVTT